MKRTMILLTREILLTSDQFLELFNRVEEESEYFSVERFKPGSSGEAKLREFLRSKIFGD